jgi:hypothetical protein
MDQVGVVDATNFLGRSREDTFWSKEMLSDPLQIIWINCFSPA